MLSAAFVAVSVFCIGIGLGYFGYIDFIVPAFTGIILLKCDLKYTILSCVVSLIIIIFIMGNIPSGIMMFQSMILGIILALFMKMRGNIFDDLFFSSIVSCIIMIFVDINFSTLTGYSFLKESINYINILPTTYDQYKDIILYMSISCLPLGTVICGYILMAVAVKKLKIEQNNVIKKSIVLCEFKRYGQFLSCTKKSICIGMLLILITIFMNTYILTDKQSYISILINSIEYIAIFFVFQDSLGIINKSIYALTKSRGKLFLYQAVLLYCLVKFFYITFLVMIILNFYFDCKYNLKVNFKKTLNDLI